jgi:hypothetical protein
MSLFFALFFAFFRAQAKKIKNHVNGSEEKLHRGGREGSREPE